MKSLYKVIIEANMDASYKIPVFVRTSNERNDKKISRETSICKISRRFLYSNRKYFKNRLSIQMKAREFYKWLKTQITVFGEDFDIKIVIPDKDNSVKLINAQKHHIIQDDKSNEKFILII